MTTLSAAAGILRDWGHEVIEKSDRLVIQHKRTDISITLGVGASLDQLLARQGTVRQLYQEHRLNFCAITTFRDVGDGDYVAARLSFRAGCFEQFLWSAQQAMEKYLKCILVLRRIPRPQKAKDVGHDLSRAIDMIGRSVLRLSPATEEFITAINSTALASRYFEVSTLAWGHELVSLDRAVWELRRFCSPGVSHADVALEEGRPAPKILLESERLERVMKSAKDPAREPLLWQNAFFGRRIRRRVKRPKWGFTAKNAPLFVIPDALSEFVKYAYVSPDAARAYAALAHERVVEQKAAKRAKRGCE